MEGRRGIAGNTDVYVGEGMSGMENPGILEPSRRCTNEDAGGGTWDAGDGS
jgi:hypothetical protein